MNKLCILSLFCLALSCLSLNNNLAGSASETDTGCIVTGSVRFSNNTPAVHSGVILHDQRLIKRLTLSKQTVAPVLIRSGYSYTDINGFYHFDSVDTGGYLIEIDDHDTLGAILPVIVPPKDTLILVNGILKRCGLIIGKVDTTGIGKNKNIAILLPEIGRIINVDSTGMFIIRNLPEWNYQMRLAVQDTIVRLPRDSVLIPVKSADTTKVIGFGTKSGTVIINGIVIENPL